jgi:hypothetical protein
MKKVPKTRKWKHIDPMTEWGPPGYVKKPSEEGPKAKTFPVKAKPEGGTPGFGREWRRKLREKLDQIKANIRKSTENKTTQDVKRKFDKEWLE